MPGVRINRSAIIKKITINVTPTVRRGFAAIARKEASWGIRNNGDLALIMGVLNFGDPDHRVPNNETGRSAPIPARPWLSYSTQGVYAYNLQKYINENLRKMLVSIPKRGQGQFRSSQKSLHPDDFMKGLAEVGRDNARELWEEANFAPNTAATLRNKTGDKPLHDTGRMNQSVITGWIKE